jgi:hypothetical protein
VYSALLFSCPELINLQPAGMMSGRSPVLNILKLRRIYGNKQKKIENGD